MALDKTRMVEELSNATILEIKDLIDTLKDTWGVTAAVAVAGPAAAGPAAVVEEKTEFDVILKSAGDKKLEVVKVVRAITGLGIKEAKDLTEAGGAVKQAVSKDEAAKIKSELEAAGASVEVK